MNLQLRLVLRCHACGKEADGKETLKDRLLSSPINDPATVLLVLVQSGYCPLCGADICVGVAQTPDHIIKRYCEVLKENAT